MLYEVITTSHAYVCLEFCVHQTSELQLLSCSHFDQTVDVRNNLVHPTPKFVAGDDQLLNSFLIPAVEYKMYSQVKHPVLISYDDEQSEVLIPNQN